MPDIEKINKLTTALTTELNDSCSPGENRILRQRNEITFLIKKIAILEARIIELEDGILH